MRKDTMHGIITKELIERLHSSVFSIRSRAELDGVEP
jgi:hypothetical protein